MSLATTSSIQDRARFDSVRYANCWEDAAVVSRALAPLEGARCLSIASAGDNTLSLLARGAASVLAVDVSPAQLVLLELKMAAFRRLDHDDVVSFLGARPCDRRAALYRELRPCLEPASRRFWDARPSDLEGGVIHAGRLERYFQTFRRFVLPLVHGRATVDALLEPRAASDRLRFHDHVWNGWRWRALVSLFFSRPVMGRLGRHAEFFRHVEGAVGRRVLERARRALVTLPAHDNPYLRYVLTGSFGPALPDYLRPEHYDRIRRGLDRVRLHLGPVEQAVAGLTPGRVDAFNLSDVAEYMDVGAYHRLLETLRPAAAPGARLAYWNLFAPRRRPSFMAGWLEARRGRARRLHRAARSFFYAAFVLEVAR